MRPAGWVVVLAAMATMAWPTWAGAQSGATPEARARALVAQMTLEEKIAFVTGGATAPGYGTGGSYDRTGIPRLGIPPFRASDSGLGIAAGGTPSTAFPAKQRLWTRFGTFPYSDQTRFKPVLSPFITGFEVQARLLAGDTADALDLMRRHFRAMLRPGPDDTGALWEKMTPEGSVDVEDGENPIDNNSLAHGWSAAPTALLSEHVLGVSPVDPGFGTWRFDPRPGDLRWAAGQVPTPAGPIRVAWHRARRPTRLRLTITAPAGTSGLMAAPVTAGTRAVTVDGRRVPVGQQIALTGGRRQHTITVVGP